MDTGWLAIPDATISFVGTTRVTPLKSSTIPPNLALSAELCGWLPNMVLECSLEDHLECDTGGAEGKRRNELLFVPIADGRTSGTERAEWDMERRLDRVEIRNG